MNDADLEKRLLELPSPELPETWRGEILASARREIRRSETQRPVWPASLVYLRNVFVRNPVTASALAFLWLLIFLFKTTTPVDLEERNLIAHYDPNQPIHLVSLQDEILLAEFLQDEPERRPARMP
jgi:hypothetical protein